MKKVLMIFVFIILILNYLVAQEKLIDVRYKGKESGLRKFIATHVHYPADAIENKLAGYSITSITITPDGKISEIATINSICKSIEEDISQVLSKTQKNWLKCDTTSVNQTFYIPIVYVFSSNEEQTALNTPICVKYNFIEPVVVTLMSFGGILPSEPDELIASRLSESLSRKEYPAAITYIDELIRRNPFRKQLYQLRISMNKNLNKSDLIIEDAQKIQNFIPGVSLDDLICH